jgi:RNA polymerase sigma factor (sigma-70 family)
MAPHTDVFSIGGSDTKSQSWRAMPEEDQSKFDSWFRAERSEVMAYLCYEGFEWHIAEDAATEAMAEAWATGVASMPYRGGWIRKAAKHAAIRLVKDNPHVRLAAKGYKSPQTDWNGTERHRLIERHHELVNAIRQLPAKQRGVMALFLLELTPNEIAKELEIPQRTVHTLLAKARTRLQALITANEKEAWSE